jgi:hypothetical protein
LTHLTLQLDYFVTTLCLVTTLLSVPSNSIIRYLPATPTNSWQGSQFSSRILAGPLGKIPMDSQSKPA